MATPSSPGMPVMSSRAKRVLIAVVAIIVAVILWFQFVGLYVDFSWYHGVDATQVFTTTILTRLVLFGIVGVGAAAVIAGALWMAYRSRPVFLPNSEGDPLVPYRAIISAHSKLFMYGVAIIIGLICGLSAQGGWKTVQLFLHGGDFGTTDEQFHHDIGFYVFRLPMIETIIGWFFTATVLAFFCVLITQYLCGGIRFSAGKHQKITAQAALQLSLLVGIFVLIKAVQYWFDRYHLLFSHRSGIFTGASYTDVHAVLAAKVILMCIAAICAIGFIVGGVLKSIKLPIIALVLLVVSGIIVGGVWPLIMQKVVVNPSAITKEVPYIKRNIAATRDAYQIAPEKNGHGEIKYVNYDRDKKGVDPSDLPDEEPNIVKNARLLDPSLLSATFTQREQLRNFYGFSKELAVDRYTVDGKTHDYVVAARQIDAGNFQDQQEGWINQHFVYTHGDGFVAAIGNKLSDGYPVFQVSDVADPDGFVHVKQPRIYYSEEAPDYAIVGAPKGQAPREYDTDTTKYTYQGSGGVPVSGFWNRLIFASHYGETKFLFTSEINSDSKIMYHRGPRERVKKKAPFLTVDTRPYPAIVDGRIVWIVDAYTTAKNYPYSQDVTLSAATTNSRKATSNVATQAKRQVSYVRNSVKATVDAYSGKVTLYQVDNDDPMLNAWKKVFPGLIKPQSDISSDLRSHFRYPEDLFEIQRSLLSKYHVNNATDFFQNSNFWKVPNDPTEANVTASQPPYYLEIALPGETTPHFVLTTAMTWFDREYIAGYMTASGDPGNYGQLTIQKLPSDTQTPGPVLIQQLFNSNTDISNYVRTRSQPGRSQVKTGNLLTLPTNKGLLYVEPLYLEGYSSSAYPQLGQVLVWYNKQVGMGPSLGEALKNASPQSVSDIDTSGNGSTQPFPSASGGAPQSGASSQPSTPSTGQTSLPPPSQTPPGNASEAFKAMQQAEKSLAKAKSSGDLGKIGDATEKLYQAVQDYLEKSGPSVTK